MGDLNEKLFGNFFDGTLADAVEEFAKDFDHDAVGQAVLLEAASRVRVGAELYEALVELDERGFTQAAWMRAHSAMAKACGETPSALNLEGDDRG